MKIKLANKTYRLDLFWFFIGVSLIIFSIIFSLDNSYWLSRAYKYNIVYSKCAWLHGDNWHCRGLYYLSFIGYGVMFIIGVFLIIFSLKRKL